MKTAYLKILCLFLIMLLVDGFIGFILWYVGLAPFAGLVGAIVGVFFALTAFEVYLEAKDRGEW